MSSYAIKQISKHNSIIEYLSKHGHNPAKTYSNKFLYNCPLPKHANDNTPSFYVFDKGDIQDFWCWGCHSGGNIIHLVHYMEGIDLTASVKKLSEGLGLNADGFISAIIQEILEEKQAPNEDEIWPHALSIAYLTYNYLHKVSKDMNEFELCEKMYQYMDKALSVNNINDIIEIENSLSQKLRSRLIHNMKKQKDEEREFIRQNLL